MRKLNQWLPEQTLNHKNEKRQVGVEIEFAGIGGEKIANIVAEHLGGDIEFSTCFEAKIINTRLGDFIIELDASYLKEIARSEPENKHSFEQLVKAVEELHPFDIVPKELMTKVAEFFVPWEVVAPPITIEQLSELQAVVDSLRDAGALGTRHAARFAFGLHLNPELPSLDIGTIVNYMQAFLCLYDWIEEREQVDFSRKVTPYINHFDTKYIQKVIAKDYAPNQSEFIDDYLDANPTRNRSMDLLPLLSHLDQERVKQVITDARVKSRPTFHYRLPNCDIDNPDWNISTPWRHWLMVERLANDAERLERLCRLFEEDLQRLSRPFHAKWPDRITQELNDWIDND